MTLNWKMLLVGVLLVCGLLLSACGGEQGEAYPDEISVEQAAEKYKAGVLMLDVRTQEEWDSGHIPGALHIPLDQLETRLDEVAKDGEVVVVCRSGNRSATGRDILRKNGYSKSSSMAGGMRDWAARGYPVE